jgi:hypothetical protein
MIRRFEEHTKPLSDDLIENVVPVIASYLRRAIGADAALTNGRLRAMFVVETGRALADTTVRAVIHHIRAEGIVADLVASSAGYYVADNAEDVIEYAESLRERAESIASIRRSLFIHSKLIPPPLDGGQLTLNL